MKMTKLYSKTCKEFYTKCIINAKQRVFFLLLTIDFLKILIDLEFLIPTLRLSHSFIQYGKNVHLFIQYGKNIHLKDFLLVGSGLTIEVDDDLSK